MLILAPLLGSFIAFLAAWCTTGSRARRTFGIALGVAALLPVWLLPARPPLFRAVCALVAFVNVMRVVDLASVEWPFVRRVLHVASVVDSRRLVRRAPRFDATSMIALIGWSALAAMGLGALAYTSTTTGLAHWSSRFGAGLVVVYAAVAALYRFLPVVYAAFGFEIPPLHVAPLLSRSVRELWGERWARAISEWLRATFFQPWARRRRPFVGVLFAFVVSAAFHAYATWVGLGFFSGAPMAAVMFAYFVAQALVMSLEQALRVRAWSPFAGHVWTVAWMLALSPLFVEPLVRILGFG